VEREQRARERVQYAEEDAAAAEASAPTVVGTGGNA
jgi:hypothetical protein